MAHLHHICDLLTYGWNKMVRGQDHVANFLFSLPFSSILQLVMPPQLVWVGLGGPHIACVTWPYNLCPFEKHPRDIFALLRHQSTGSAKAATSTDTITFQRSLAELDFTFLMCRSLAMPLLISFSMAVVMSAWETNRAPKKQAQHSWCQRHPPVPNNWMSSRTGGA